MKSPHIRAIQYKCYHSETLLTVSVGNNFNSYASLPFPPQYLNKAGQSLMLTIRLFSQNETKLLGIFKRKNQIEKQGTINYPPTPVRRPDTNAEYR